MAILAECPLCHKKQATKNKLCDCGADLVNLKRSKKVKYWINYRLPGGRQRREAVGYSIEEARDADGKRRSQKRENRIFDIKPEAKMTFHELAEWYLGLEKVKALASYWRIKIALERFNSEFGEVVVSQTKPADLENYQAMRKREGRADNTIDSEIGAAKTMVFKAFDNDLVGGETLRTFKRVKKMLKRNANARSRILSREEFDRLLLCSPAHLQGLLITGFYTGMRLGEILNLTWDRVDLKDRVIRLEAGDTKDREPRVIPIGREPYDLLANIRGRIRRAGDGSHVFLYKGKPIKSIKTALRHACDKAGITHGRFVKAGFVYHDLRHTFNTNMRKAGVPESVIMQITGHSTREMFDRYNTIDTEDTRRAIDQLQAYLANVDQNVDQVPKKENFKEEETV